MLAKTVMPGKFWIVEDNGVKKGTLQAVTDGSYNALIDGVQQHFADWDTVVQKLALNTNVTEEKVADIEATIPQEVYGYPTNCVPYNLVWDVKQKLPLFTKARKSQSQHAAGYYIIHFEHGWVNSFCPKLSTLHANEWQGPFKTKLEMRERLRLADA